MSESLLGLGFAGKITSKNESSATPSINNSMDALMQSYMQQCLSYHEEQMIQEKNASSHSKCEEQKLSAPIFIPSATRSGNTDLHNIDDSKCTSNPIQSEEEETFDKAAEFQQRLQNARLIAQRLASKPIPKEIVIGNQQQQTEPYYPYAEKRRTFLTNIHSNKLHSFLMKNFNYILKKDEEIHILQIQHLQEQRMKEMQLRKHQQQQRKRQMMGRSSMINNVMGGIGTEERNQVQRSIDKNHHSFMMKRNNINNNKRMKKNENCCSVYISGIKVYEKEQGSSLSTHDQRQKRQHTMIRETFESYGTIENCHFYKDKILGVYKGDALIVFNWKEIQKDKHVDDHKCDGEENGSNTGSNANTIDESSAMINFLSMICSQVRKNYKRFFSVPCVLCINCIAVLYENAN